MKSPENRSNSEKELKRISKKSKFLRDTLEASEIYQLPAQVTVDIMNSVDKRKRKISLEFNKEVKKVFKNKESKSNQIKKEKPELNKIISPPVVE